MFGEIAIVNASQVYPLEEQWKPILWAIQMQLTRDVGSNLGVTSPVLTYHVPGKPLPPKVATLIIQDEADMPNALGYHSEDLKGRIYGKVFVNPIVKHGGTLNAGPLSCSVTMSHEIIEMMGNRFVQMWVDNPVDGYQYCGERADPVEEQFYVVERVSVSNFVLDAWFDGHASLDSKFDFLGRLRAPFSVAPGGYMVRRRPGSVTTPVFGSTYPAWKAMIKASHGRIATRTQ